MAAAAQILPYFGRIYEVTVQTPEGKLVTLSSSDMPQPVRVAFHVETYMLLSFWSATITLTNMTDETVSAVTAGSVSLAEPWRYSQPLTLGSSVFIKAGYAGNGAALIYQGKIHQSIIRRRNVVDWELSLHCITGLIEDAWNNVNLSIGKGATAQQTVAQICASCGIPIEAIDPAATKALSAVSDPGGQAFSHRPLAEIDTIARQFNLQAWLSPNGLNLRKFDPNATLPTPPFAYGAPRPATSQAPPGGYPKNVRSTLIDTPEQTQDGVVFRVLLDGAPPKIYDVVQLAPDVLINPVEIKYTQTRPPIPATNGLYLVAGISHVGDTREESSSWYTEIHGVNPNFFVSFLDSRNPTQ
jgi:hypothetical protein